MMFFWKELIISFAVGASSATAICLGFVTLHQTKPEKEYVPVPPCCYVPGKGIQVCADAGSLMLPEESGMIKGVGK